jgi:hypothetical protein
VGKRHIVSGLLALTVATGCETNAETVGPRGGDVSSLDGRFAIVIPEGALDHDVDITVEQVECEQDTAVGPCYEVGPRGTAFLHPAEVSYEIADMDLSDVDPSRLGVVTERGADWRVLSDRSVDEEDEVVYATAMYLSSFALVPVE